MAVSFKDPSRYMSGTHNLSVTGSISLFQSAGHDIFFYHDNDDIS